jgi:AraC family transcriptional regulator, positive regulator of tynA and feaB
MELAAGVETAMVRWSTETIDARDRFSFWREVVCQTVLNVAIELPRERLSARMTGRSFGDLRFAAFDSTGYEIVRSRQHVARAPVDHYLISLQLRGQSHISQDDETIALEPGEISVFDGQRPFHITFSESVSRTIAVVPRAMLDRCAPVLRASPRRKISSDAPFADLARRHLLLLTAGEDRLSEHEATQLTKNLCNLLALARTRDVTPSCLQPELMLEAMLAFCRRNLHDPELSPQLVAARFGISVRTLHLRFEKLGQSFGRWLLERRLNACSRALRDPHQLRCSISEIAYRWGFNDLSHFNKTFRTRFGMPPGQWRSRREP